MRYVALLRGVSPTNAAMPHLRKAFEAAGFTEVTTFLSSGNVVFSAPAAAAATLQRRAEAAMTKRLGRAFLTIVRPMDRLRELIASDPYRTFGLDPQAKRIITFLLNPPKPIPKLPIVQDGVHIVAVKGIEAFAAYLPCPKGPVFMTLLQKTFGKEQTTRTWQTVARIAR